MSRKKVDFYKITLNKKHDCFAISPKFIHKDYLKFIYELNDEVIEKIVPMNFIGPRLGKQIHIWHKDELTDEKEYYGYFYPIKSSYIINYHG